MSTQQQLTQQINERERRLHQLKLQQARQGYTVDPAITMEIEDIERELTGLRRWLATAPADPVDSPPIPTDYAGREASSPQPTYGGSGNVIITGGTFTTGDRSVLASLVHGDITTGDTTTGLGDDALTALFETLARQIAANPALDEVGKEDMAADVNDLQTTLTASADAPEAKENFWLRRLRNIERMAPDLIDTIATTAVNPAAGLKTVWDKIVAKAREMQAARLGAGG